MVILAFQQKSFGQTTISDTTFILRDTSGGNYHAIYIEDNQKSRYYDLVTDFKFGKYDSKTYQASINALFKERKPTFPKIEISPTLPRQWCGLHTYKDEFYLYAPSDGGYNRNLMITDTTIIAYFIDGPFAYVIDKFKAIEPNTFEFSVHSAYGKATKIFIHIIDREKQLAIVDKQFGEEHFYTLLVGKSKARQFPIIVNHGRHHRHLEFNFDKTDYKGLLTHKK